MTQFLEKNAKVTHSLLVCSLKHLFWKSQSKESSMIMDNASPKARWNELIATARKLMAETPWERIPVEMLFGVYHEPTDQILYCTALGNLEDVYGLSIYPGKNGLYSHNMMIKGKLDSTEPRYYLRSLLVSFESQSYLTNEDKKILKKSKQSFRGTQRKPQFRSYIPGYMEDLPDQEEGHMMLTAMQGTLNLLEQQAHIRDDDFFSQTKIPIAIFDSKAGKWAIRYQAPESGAQVNFCPPRLNELEIQSLRKQSIQKGTWEGGVFFMPKPVEENHRRAYFPCLSIWVEQSSGYVLNFDTSSPEDAPRKLVETFLQAIKNSECIPERIHISHENYLDILDPFVETLKIHPDIKGVMPSLDDAITAMNRTQFPEGPVSPFLLSSSLSGKDDEENKGNFPFSNLFKDFHDWLEEKGLKAETVEKHLKNASFYLVTFNAKRPETDLYKADIADVDAFFREWVPEFATSISPSRLKEMITSINKLYHFLGETGYIPREQTKVLTGQISKRKQGWIAQPDL